MRMPMSDLTKKDLGAGFTLVFQRSIKDTNAVRAIIRGADGQIHFRGPVVTEAKAEDSARAVIRSFEDEAVGNCDDFAEEMMRRFGPIGGFRDKRRRGI